MDYLYDIASFVPQNEQEAADRTFFLEFASAHPDCLSRSCDLGHFTASSWIVTPDRSKVLMVWHNLYKSWSWTGGHADGDPELSAVALREAQEETGAQSLRLVSPLPVSLETLAVPGHVRHGRFLHSHLHLNLSYLIEADERDVLSVCPEENSAVRWFTPEAALAASREPWMVETVYRKLIRAAEN